MLSMLKGLVGSRKWAVGIATIALISLNKKLGLNMSLEEIGIVAGVAGILIAGESYRDGKAAEAKAE